jgi:ABC-type glycerol-3-phosphate transport system substrate-binding protein
MKKTKCLVISALLFSLLLTSCGKTADATASADAVGEAEYEWVAEIYDNYDSSNAIIASSLSSCGNTVYFSTTDTAFPYNHVIFPDSSTEQEDGEIYNKFYRWDYGAAEPEKLPISGHAAASLSYDLNIQSDSSDNIYIVYDRCYGKYDSSGNEIFYNSFPQDPTDDVSLSLLNSAIDSDGNLYALLGIDISQSGNTLYTINSDGSVNATATVDGTFLTNDSENTVYCTNNVPDFDVLPLNFDGTTGDAVLSNASAGLDFKGYTDGKFIENHSSCVYMYDTVDGSIVSLFKWSDLGIDSNNVLSCCGLSDGTIVAVLDEKSLSSSLNHVGSSIAFISYREATSKTILTLGVLTAAHELLVNVSEFNRQQTDCKIEVKEYYDYTTDTSIDHSGYYDAITKFHLDIASGNCPDIMCLDYDYLENYAKKGLFTDLTPYLETCSVTLPENILSAYTFDNALVSIPPVVDINTTSIPSYVLNGKTGWTLAEMMSFVDENNNSIDGVPIFLITNDALLKYCLKFNLNHFIDSENSTCNFETDEFYSLLEFCNKYGTETEYAYKTFLRSQLLYFNAIAHELTFDAPSDNVFVTQTYGTDDVTYIGYPTDTGSGCLLSEEYGSLSIFSGSENKELAWEFIEFALANLHKYDVTASVSGYPAAVEVFEQYAENETGDPTVNSRGNLKYEWGFEFRRSDAPTISIHKPTDEEFAPIPELLSTATVPSSYDSTIMDVILENAQDYFDGIHDTAYVASQIQSRVSIYLSERQ